MNEIKEYNKVEEIMLEGEWYAHTIYTYAWTLLKNKGLRDYSVEILKKEDEEKNTDLYETLKMYYLCGNNIAETASRMYVHRNTLVYRLRKIRELIGSDIDLGQLIECSIEFPTSHSISINKIDMTSTDTNQKNITIQVNICSSYPAFNELSEISNSSVIGKMSSNIEAYANNDIDYTTDYQRKNIDMTKEDDKLVDNIVYEKENL